MLQAATRSANKVTSRLLQIFKSRSRSLRRLKRRSDSMAKASEVSPSVPPNGKSSHAAVQTRENLKCDFCGHCCGAAFTGGWNFEMSFDQPSCTRYNEHNNKVLVDFMLDCCMQLSQMRRTFQRTGSTAKSSKCFGQSSVALSHRRKLMHATVQARENLCSLCGLARC